MPKVVGQFDLREERELGPTFGMNAKRGKDNTEFVKFIFNSIVPIYPDAADTRGNQIILKVNSGLG